MRDLKNICPRISWSGLIRLSWETSIHWSCRQQGGDLDISFSHHKCFRRMCKSWWLKNLNTACCSCTCWEGFGRISGQDLLAEVDAEHFACHPKVSLACVNGLQNLGDCLTQSGSPALPGECPSCFSPSGPAPHSHPLAAACCCLECK